MPFLYAPVPHTEAVDRIRSKPAVARRVFDRMLPEVRALAFTVTGIDAADVLQRVRDTIAELPAGGDWATLKKEIVSEISPYFDSGSADPDQQEKDAQAAHRRAELLLRLHGNQAYSATAHRLQMEQADLFPYRQYIAQGDDRVRPSHAALDGLVIPVNHPFWETHTPPWDFGCRCDFIPVSEDSAAAMKAQDAGKDREHQRVLDDLALDALKTRDQVVRPADPLAGKGMPTPFDVRSPENKGGTYRWRAGELKPDVHALRKRYDAPVWAAFEGWAKRQILPELGVTVWDWLNESKPLPRLPSTGEEAVRRAIRKTKFKDKQLVGGPHANEAFRLTAPSLGVIWKPGAGEASGLRIGRVPDGTQHKREVAASILDEELEIGMVPPTTLLARGGKSGSAQLWKEGYRKPTVADMAKLTSRQAHDWQLLDELMANLDRRPDNYLVREIEGRPPALALIDNGLSFPRTYVAKTRRIGLEFRPIDQKNMERLALFLSREPQIRTKFKGLLEDDAIDRLFERAQRLFNAGTYDISRP